MWSLLFAAAIYLVTFCVSARSTNDPTVIRLYKGWVRGIRHNVLHGTIVHEYSGIPMGKPPIGHLRFRRPVPVDPWDGTFNATKRPKACWQIIDTAFPGFRGSEIWNNNTEMSEDCLYINVWIPNPEDTRKKAIMVWIYGGGFFYGSSALDIYEARYLAATQNVIVVSMNYRLGMLGFLSLGVDDCPGNMGLFDQLLGLKWVQENADYIKGDKNNVTLFGESAGSVSVSLHLLSPKSRPLFSRAIMESGTALADWAIMDLESSWHRLNKTAFNPHSLACNETSNVKKILDCLRKIDAQKISINDWAPNGLIQFNFLPTIDNDFLIERPEASLKKRNFKKCPIMLGSNSNEGSWFILYEFYNTFGSAYRLPEINFTIDSRKFEELLRQSFRYYPQWDKRLNTFGHEAIAYRYRDWRFPDDTVRNRYNLDMAVGDFHFLCPSNKFAEYYINEGLPVYSYLFTHRSSQNDWGRWTGVMHGDEVAYVFGEPLRPESLYTAEEKNLSLHMMELWANFSKTSFPMDRSSEIWPPASAHMKEFYEISLDSLTQPRVGSGPRIEYCAFWDKYLPKLVEGTADIQELEVEWKRNFNEWSTKYIVDWKNEYNVYMKSHEPCEGGRP